MRWRRLIGAIGAECTDADVLAADPAALRRAALEHQLIVLRGQRLAPASLTELAAGLGELDVYPFAEPLAGAPFVVAVVKNPGDTVNFGGAWHSDTAYLPKPPSFTLLYAVEVPGQGGDTLFADMYGAFASLSAGMRRMLCTLEGHNTASLVHDAGGELAAVAGQSVAPRRAAVPVEAQHPLVRSHPETGRAALYLSLTHTAHIVGMTRAESLPLLTRLQDHATAAENCTRLRWAPGTLAIWDNRCLLHYPLNDYPGKRREMHRVILKGERPEPVLERDLTSAARRSG